MDQMIDTDLIKKLRNDRAWSQEQLSTISGLSLRTVQRIEKEGRCSQDSKKALAVAFEIDASAMDFDQRKMSFRAAGGCGKKFGFLGATLGLLGAYSGITISLVSGSISSGDAGLYYGGTGIFCGVCCAIIGCLSNNYHGTTA